MMSPRPLVVATLPFYGEDAATLARALESVEPWLPVYVYEAPLYRYGTESALRDVGRQYAQSKGARWWLQLDSDERLIGGDLLADLLADFEPHAYPLPRAEENGAVSICPYKLVRLPCRLVSGCDHFRFPLWTGEIVWRLSLDRSASEQEIPDLLQLPHLAHEPGRALLDQPDRSRLGETENVLQVRPADAVAWPDTFVRAGGNAR